MIYAVISDIHANRQAFQAVLTDIRGQGADNIICLGDVVGYGPAPAEVMEQAYASVHHFLLGNHDAVLAGKVSADCFNDNARQMIEWTAAELDAKAGKFFARLPLVIEGENCRFAHAELVKPGRFGYIMEDSEASASFAACAEPLIFVGHTHIPGIHVVGASGRAHWVEPTDFAVEPGKRYIVNAGSVGQPRDCDFRASYCLFDSESMSVHFRKVPFDLDAYRADLQAKVLSETSSYFLAVADSRAPAAAREMLGFKPSSNRVAVAGPAEVLTLRKTVSDLRRRQWMLLALCLAVVAAALTGGVYAWGRIAVSARMAEAATTEAARLAAATNEEEFTTIAAAGDWAPVIPRDDRELIGFNELEGVVDADNPMSQWTVRLSDPARQSVAVERDGVDRILVINSGARLPMMISHQPVAVERGMVFVCVATFQQAPKTPINGNLLLMLEHQNPEGARMTYEFRSVKDYANFARGIWTRVQFTPRAAVPEDGEITMTIRGEFVGEVRLRRPSLKLRP